MKRKRFFVLAAVFALLGLFLPLVSVERVQADEFIGPLAGWANIKQAPYNAVGDGRHDDTEALQRALDDLGTGGHAKALYLPAGTYVISRTLTMTGRAGVSILGEDPARTIIKWQGAQGGTMITVQNTAYSRYERITWDGGGIAQTAWWDSFDGTSNYFPTGNEHADEVFENVGYGIRAGKLVRVNGGDAETPVLRCRFLNCSVAGLSVEDPNVLDWFLWYCTFQNCAIGAANDAAPAGAGNFHVYYSLFEHSTVADISIGNTQYFSFRNNYSIGSRKFFLAKYQGANSAKVTLQKNVILDPLTTPIDVANAGPVMLIDNVIRYGTSPVVRVGTGEGEADVVSIGNTYTAPDPIKVQGRARTLDDKTVSAADVHPPAPTMPATPPNDHRPILEVSATAGDAEIQQAIRRAATQYAGQRPIVHIPQGRHDISRTLTVPAGSDAQIVGDGFLYATVLKWTGAGTGPVLQLASPCRATLRDFSVEGDGATDGVVVHVGDHPGDRVYVDQVYLARNSHAGLVTNGLDHAVVELHDLYHNASQGTSVVAIGGPVEASGGPWGGGRTNIYGGQSASNKYTYDLLQNAHLMSQDMWYEEHSPSGTFMHLTQSGTFTLQSAEVAVVADASIPGIHLDGFQGKATFLNVNVHTVRKTNSFKMKVQSPQSAKVDLLIMGMQGDNGDWFRSDALQSDQAHVGFLNNKAAPAVGVPGSRPLEHQGLEDPAFVRAMLAQTRTEYPSPLPLAAVTGNGVSDVRLYRIGIQNARTCLTVQSPSAANAP